ncbi:MAG: glucan biosynthesis protein G [Pseudomonadota bacterium]|nr:glucan biosynthesis protein G [Pseudomonadota bacterium]
MNRRDLIAGSLAVSATWATRANAADAAQFDGGTVKRLARDRAATAFKPADRSLPEALAKLGYDDYRSIRFDPAQSLWRGAGLPFEAQFFHRGWLYSDRVDIFEVVDGAAQPITYRGEMFSFGAGLQRPQGDLGFAGFRLHAPLNRPEYYDEVCVFLGASYFRAVGKRQGYGLSSRGLSLKTGDQGGEEFPAFRSFWLERPQRGTNSIVVHALLDSPSCAAAIRFTIRPGDDTIMDMETALYPRVDLTEVGVGNGTSMFYFAPSDRVGIDDYRRAVHDSDGLMMATGRGEQVWRPLFNPQKLQISSFADTSPRGFGLVQRHRQLSNFEDLEAHYERRPSLWVEPIGDWGEGQVQLIEIPTKDEVHDNIVAFWRPKQKLIAKSEVSYTCRLHWADLPPIQNPLARFTAFRAGVGTTQGARLFVLDLAGETLKTLPDDAKPRVDLSADKGKVENVVAIAAPELGGWRISFELLPGGADTIELRLVLMNGDVRLSETWLYRWTA